MSDREFDLICVRGEKGEVLSFKVSENDSRKKLLGRAYRKK